MLSNHKRILCKLPSMSIIKLKYKLQNARYTIPYAHEIKNLRLYAGFISYKLQLCNHHFIIVHFTACNPFFI